MIDQGTRSHLSDRYDCNVMSKKVLVPNHIFTITTILSPAECAEYIAFSENMGYTSALITTHRGFELRQM